jgi:thiamine pyrophosphokinase
MRAIVIANGHVGNSEASRAETWTHDLVICADGGAQHALTLGLAPDVVIGDLDSLDSDLQARLESEGCQILVHPTRKDETDLELALRYAVDHGVDEILILGALGELEGVKTRIAAGDQEMFLIRGQAFIKGRVGDTVSLLPIGGDATGIITEGLEYPLQCGALKFGATWNVVCYCAFTYQIIQKEAKDENPNCPYVHFVAVAGNAHTAGSLWWPGD